jgi:hypothetical protein
MQYVVIGQRGVPADPKDCPCSSFSFRSKSTRALIRIVPARQKQIAPLGNPPPKHHANCTLTTSPASC